MEFKDNVKKLRKEYEVAYSKGKVDKALAALEQLFEMEDWQGTRLLIVRWKQHVGSSPIGEIA